MKILNFTQHTLTREQLDSLVGEGFSLENIETEAEEWVKALLTFTNISDEELKFRARALADYAQIQCEATDVIVDVDGAPYLMGALEKALIENGIKPRYAFTEYVVVETMNQDGSTTETSVIRQSGWRMGSLIKPIFLIED